MNEGNGLEGVPISTASHTIETALKAKVLMGADSHPMSIVLTGEHGVEMKWPGFAFPFIKNGATVLCVCTIVQVSRAERAAPPKILRPGN